MSNEVNSVRRAPWAGAFFSPRYFLMRAAALGLLFLLAHVAGLRDYTTFVSGTTGNPEVSMRLSVILGMTYLTLYMGCVVLAPILIIAAALLKLREKWGTNGTGANISEQQKSSNPQTGIQHVSP